MERIDNPVERLRRIGRAYVEFAIAYPHHYRIMFMTTIPMHDHPEKNPEEDAYGFLVDTVKEGIERGLFRPDLTDPEELAQVTWGGVHGLISLHLAKCNAPWIDWRDLRRTSEKSIDALVRGLVRDRKD